MSSREISIWIDERWYDALTRNLKGDTLEERLEEFVDQMCNQLPEHEYERISREIWQEQQERKQEQEAARKFAVFHLVENGKHSYLQVERSIEMLDAARMLRAYRRHSTIADTFGQTIHAAQAITQEQFNARVHERLDNTGKVTGAFEAKVLISYWTPSDLLCKRKRKSLRSCSSTATKGVSIPRKHTLT